MIPLKINNYNHMNKAVDQYIVRVYGIVINGNQELLLSDEFQLNTKMTKFPGGGMDFGEGTIDCLRREFREECSGQEILNISHFYTTDFFKKLCFMKMPN